MKYNVDSTVGGKNSHALVWEEITRAFNPWYNIFCWGVW